MNINSFTIRAYGLLIHDGRILLSKENIKGEIHVKFPSGGLEFGEGLVDCVKREFDEETGLQIVRTEHFYTTEDFFASAFHKNKQVLSIYYRVWVKDLKALEIGNPSDEHLLKNSSDQILYWCDLKGLGSEPIDLPIDAIVVGKLVSHLL